jgi:hypothetical protein
MSARADELEPLAVVHFTTRPALLAQDGDRNLLESPAAQAFFDGLQPELRGDSQDAVELDKQMLVVGQAFVKIVGDQPQAFELVALDGDTVREHVALVHQPLRQIGGGHGRNLRRGADGTQDERRRSIRPKRSVYYVLRRAATPPTMTGNPTPNRTQARPPDARWRPLDPGEPATGYASYYLSDELAIWPVRAITRIKDNKSDPNLETGTYGLFSTCQREMRSGIVRDPPRYVFFVTRPREGPRQLTGYYRLGWYTPGSLHRRIRDFALAADAMRFVDSIPLPALPDGLAATLAGRWRLNKRLTAAQTEALAALVDGLPDRTPEYLREIDRLETINRFHSGYRYPSWRRDEPWTWADAGRYLREAPLDPTAPKLRNSSPTGWWRCASCKQLTENAALLKACPHCHELDTLRPAAANDLQEIA